MIIIKNEKEILENYFAILKNENGYELESCTNEGVDMIIPIKRNGGTLLEQLKEYIDNFDIDNEIDICRKNEEYKNNFTIKESIKDFEDYISYVKDLIDKLEINEENEEFLEELVDDEEYEPLEPLIGVCVNDTEKGLKIMLIGYDNNMLGEYEIEMNIKGYKEMELSNVCYEISKDIKNLYYSIGRVPTKEEVLNAIRGVMVK
ncbi:MAG: hypothetical protein MST00_06650 [Tenericutes bacterium]|nr:hypothetical protein [Mycoplasmatota bacterium]